MSNSPYDAIANQYASMVQNDLSDDASVLATATRTLLSALGDLRNKDVCDLACGEGHLSLLLAQKARFISGIDLSSQLVDLANTTSKRQNVSFLVDDAQTLISQSDHQFDLVFCNLALMDIPDLGAVYRTVFRVLRQSGRFIFSITHPCFQSPRANIHVDSDGRFSARCITTYASEGFWRSDNPSGLRGQVGAYHRMLSTYLNLAVKAGFTIVEMREPSLQSNDYASPHAAAQVEVPSVMVIILQK